MGARFATVALCWLCLLAQPLPVRAQDTAAVAAAIPPPAVSQPSIRITPYGMLWGNMLYATQRVNPGEFTLFVLSRDSQDEDVFTTDARRSRIGLTVEGPMIPLDGGLKSGGRAEVDFLGEFITENQPQARLRHAYWEASNQRQKFLVGLTTDVISPLYPRMLNFSIGWLGGNMGFRRAQFRYERYEFWSDQLSSVLQLSLNQDITPDFSTEALVRREASNFPVIEGRVAVSLSPYAGERPATVGVSGHCGETGFDFLGTGPPPLNLPPQNNARFLTWSYNLDLDVPLSQHLDLQAEFFQGRNLSPFLGGIGQGICSCTRSSILSLGGWADVRCAWTDRLSSTLGYGMDDPRNDDLLLGRTLNQFVFGNLVWMVTPDLSTGLEISFWRTLYQDRRAGLIPDADLGPTAPGNSVTVEYMVKYEF